MGLSDKESLIAQYVIEGKTNQEIATAVGVSVNTLKGYLETMRLKTNTAGYNRVCFANALVGISKGRGHK